MLMTETPAAPKHLSYLDSARGIAAIMVMVYHFIVFRYGDELPVKVASIVFNGSDAVSFFFVLSGFVLSYKTVVLGESMDVGRFFVSRFFRLWPAYFLTLLLNVNYNLSLFHYSAEGFREVFIENNNGFWQELMLLRSVGHYYIPGWTLGVEMTLSLLVPFWIIIGKKSPRFIWWLILVNLLGFINIYFTHFMLGILLSFLYTYISSASFKATRWYQYRYALIAAAIVLFSIRHIERISHFGPSYFEVARFFGVDFFHYTGFASFVFLAAIIQSPKARQVLAHGILTFFGKISYGIYLMHWLIVVYAYSFLDQLKQSMPENAALGLLLAATIAATILSAVLLHYLVELPFIKMGKNIARKMKPTLIVGNEPLVQ